MTAATAPWRPLVLAVLFAAAAAVSAQAGKDRVPGPADLERLPRQFGEWRGENGPTFTEHIVATLGVDEYVNRVYASVARTPVLLYVGYYASQRTGSAIHSPQNCLPGAGWLPVRTTDVRIDVPGRAAPITVNQVLIRKGLDRQVVLYWYHSHGRVVASDYWSKLYLVSDALRLGRSDAALVRVITPVVGDEPVAAAEKRAADFVREAFGAIDGVLPA
jgi:EpsI family protein